MRLLPLLLAWCVAVSAQTPSITELMARNATGLKDEDSDPSDWIEIHNPGPGSLNLGGWYLTDDATQLTQWKLPSVSVQAGRYLVVFASGKDRATQGKPLHTGFKLDGDGEYLALVKPDGRTLASSFAPTFPDQRTDISYGTRVGASGQGYFTQATPGAKNGKGLPGIVSIAEIQVSHGLHDNPFATMVTCATSGATIRYTVDGSPPTATNGKVYSGPLTISKTTVLRTAAFKANHVTSPTDTQTFVFVEDVVRQPNNPPGYPTTWGGSAIADYEMDPQIVNDPVYKADVRKGLRALPTISIALPASQLFGSGGLYPNSTRARGRAWERACSAELIPTGDGDGFRVDCGVRLQGGYSRNWYASPKHSFSLRFRNAYGKGKLDYPVFGGSAAREFDSIWLRSVFNNSWISRKGDQRSRGMMIRDLWARETMVAMGHDDAGRDQHAHLYINGLYWGVYLLQERQDSAHFAIWHGGTEDDYDARNANKFINGTSAHWNSAVAAVNRRDWTAINNLIDIDNFIDWMITNQYAANTDFRTSGNWRSAGGGSAKARWRFYCWDAEYSFASVNWRNLKDPSGIFATMRLIPEFAVRYGDRLHRHLFNAGSLTPKAAAARWQRRADEIEHGIVAESARWGDYRRDVHRYISGPYELYTRNQHFRSELNRLMTSYFPQRTGILLAYMRSLGLYPTVAAPVFSQHGGSVPAGFRLKVTPGSGAIWYTLDGKDPRLPGGQIDPGARRYTTAITITDTTLIKARVRSGNNWSALNEAQFVVDSAGINEALAINKTGIMDKAGEREDWIELYNQGSKDVAVGGMYLTDDAANLRKWQIPSGNSIKPGACLLIWADEDAHQGPLHANFKLSGSGEDLLLVHTDGRTVLDRMTFGRQQSDISSGRFRDGEERLVSFLDPSPRAVNDIATCGPRRYSALDPTQQPLTLSLAGQPGIGKSVRFEARGGPAKTVHGFLLATGADEAALPFSTSQLLCKSPLFTLGIVTSNSNGDVNLPITIPLRRYMVGKRLYFQSWTIRNNVLIGSNGLELRFCQ